MTPTAFKGIVVLDTQAQFEQLSTTGTLVIGTETITYQPTSYLYYVKEGGIGVTQQELNSAIASVQAQIPTALSQLTQDTTHRTVTDTEKAAWNAKQNSPVVKTGTTAPTDSTVADFVGQFYLDTATPKTYQCTAISNGVYTWSEVGGSGGGGALYKHIVNMSSSSDMEEFHFMFYSSSDTTYDNFDDFTNNNIGLKLYLPGYEASMGGNFPIQSLEVISSSEGLYMWIYFWDSFSTMPRDKRIDNGSGWADSFSEDVIEC